MKRFLFFDIMRNYVKYLLIGENALEGRSRRAGVTWKVDRPNPQERKHVDEPNPVPARDVASGGHDQAQRRRAMHQGARSGVRAAGLQVPVVACGALRWTMPTQAVSMQWQPLPDFVDRGHPFHEYEYTAEKVAPRNSAKLTDKAVGVGVQATGWGPQLPNDIADALEDHAHDGRAGMPAPVCWHRAAQRLPRRKGVVAARRVSARRTRCRSRQVPRVRPARAGGCGSVCAIHADAWCACDP